MLSNKQEKIIRAIKTKKGRQYYGLCLVEGQKNIETAKKAIEFTFSQKNTPRFAELITTETPQPIAAVAHIPKYSIRQIESNDTIVLLDGVQDPGNVGSILRLCLGFNASLLLVESADPTSPKVIRSSAGAMFNVPWHEIPRDYALKALEEINRPVYLLEIAKDADHEIATKKCIIIVGSEGVGVQLSVVGESITVPHSKKLESLNVGHALAIILSKQYRSQK